MPSATPNLAEAKRIIAAIEGYLRSGLPRPQAVRRTAADFRLARTTLESRLEHPDGSYLRSYGLSPDWGLYAPSKTPKPASGLPTQSSGPAPDKDFLTLRRHSDSAAVARAAQKAAEQHAIRQAAQVAALFPLRHSPIEPPDWPTPEPLHGKHREALILFLSDAHNGEVIDLNRMGGRNSFNQEICGNRIARLFRATVSLATEHGSGPPPSVVYLVLGGDLISGEIHAELAKYNDLLAIPAVRSITGHIIAGIKLLLASLACPLVVISLPGNHGRDTLKPESKGFALNSYDTLVAWNVQMHFEAIGETRITFSAPESGDAIVNICGWNFLFTHGDRIGSRGGQGFVGPAATVARGMQKILMDYAAAGTVIDYIVVGHFHTALELSQGFCNGSIPGPSEYGMTMRMRPEPASQWLLSVHPVRGVARRWKILIGDPSEGSIYNGREAA